MNGPRITKTKDLLHRNGLHISDLQALAECASPSCVEVGDAAAVRRVLEAVARLLDEAREYDGGHGVQITDARAILAAVLHKETP